MSESPELLIQEALQEEISPRQSYDMVIPGEIRANDNLSRDEKYLYAIIRNLTSMKGYCWATNAYLASEMGVSERTIRNWIGHLKDEGVVEVELISHKMINRRRMWMPGMRVFKKSLIRKPASASSGSQFPDDREASFLHTEERVTEEKKREEEGAPPPTPPPSLLEFGKHVRLTQEDFEKFATKYGKDVIEKKIEAMNDWISRKEKDPYSDYAAALRSWFRRDSVPGGLENQLKSIESNKDLIKKIEARFPDKIKSRSIVIGSNYIEFDFGHVSPQVKTSDNGFKEQIFNHLRKMNLSLEGL